MGLIPPPAWSGVDQCGGGAILRSRYGLFAVMLATAGLLTLRCRVLARWTGVVALLGALAFLITFFALIQGTSEDSIFGYGFLPGILALVIWSIVTSVASYRAVR